jgi:hypothetical protein
MAKPQSHYVTLTNKMQFLNYCFNSILVFYMFRTSYFHRQEDCIVHVRTPIGYVMSVRPKHHLSNSLLDITQTMALSLH